MMLAGEPEGEAAAVLRDIDSNVFRNSRFTRQFGRSCAPRQAAPL
jgi:hypothetical protein